MIPVAVGTLRRAAAGHPGWVDGLLAVAAHLVATLAVTTSAEERTAAGWLLGAVGNAVLLAPLAWRRRAPLAVLTLTGAGVLAALATVGPVGGEPGVLLALATSIAREPDARRLVLVAAPVVTLDALAAIATARPGSPLHGAVVVTAAVLAAVSAGIAARSRRAQLTALADRARQAELTREREAELAVAEERERLARELHDVVAHHVSVIVALADGAQYAADRDPAAVRRALEQVSATGRETLRDLRGLLGVLRDGGGPGGGRGPQPGLAELDGLLDRVRAAGLAARLRTEGAPVALPPLAELTIYRVVQEALTNVLRHAPHAARAEVCLRYAPDAVRVTVVDDGGPGAQPGTGRGLAGMRERARLHGGDVVAGPSGRGWAVALRLPTRTVRP